MLRPLLLVLIFLSVHTSAYSYYDDYGRRRYAPDTTTTTTTTTAAPGTTEAPSITTEQELETTMEQSPKCPPQDLTIYHTNGNASIGSIRRTADDPTKFEELVSVQTQHKIASLAFDRHNNEVFFVSKQAPHQILAFNKAFREHIVVEDESRTFERILVDPITNNIYYTAEGHGIGVCTGHGHDGKCVTLIHAPTSSNSTVEYVDLLLHPTRGLMFWIEREGTESSVKAASMDGTHIRQLRPFNEPFSIALDAQNNLLYVAEKGDVVVFNLETHASQNIEHLWVTRLAYFNCHLYYVGSSNKMLWVYSEEDGSYASVHKSLEPDFSFIVVPEKQETPIPNPCKQALCPWICVLAEDGHLREPSTTCVRNKPRTTPQITTATTPAPINSTPANESALVVVAPLVRPNVGDGSNHFLTFGLLLAIFLLIQIFLIVVVYFRFWPTVRAWMEAKSGSLNETSTVSDAIISFKHLESEHA